MRNLAPGAAANGERAKKKAGEAEGLTAPAAPSHRR
jgi:hypothetical protein